MQHYVSLYAARMTESATTPVRRPDRRAERSTQAILAATRELLGQDGDVGSLTVEAVAARSGVAKTTIYRRWRDKWELALDAVMIDELPGFDDPVDVGDTRKELLTFVNSVVKMLAATPFGPAMQGLVSQIATDPGLARIYREQVVQPRLAQLAPVIERGIARGDLRAGTEVRLVHELLVGPIFYRLLLSGGPLDRNLGPRLVDPILAGFAPRRPRESLGDVEAAGSQAGNSR
jgi:AcrR family transcriptional regulator